MADLFHTIPEGAIPQYAAKAIQKMIAEGQFKPGQLLPSQRDLAVQLNISRTSLREALSVLSTLGLIHIQPGKGVYVRNTHPSDEEKEAAQKAGLSKSAEAREVYQLRYALEPFAAGLAAPKVSDEVLGALKSNVKAMRHALETDNLVDAAYLDFEFHSLLINAADNHAFSDVVQHYRSMLMKNQQLPYSRFAKSIETANEHEAIVKQLEHRSLQGVTRAMQAHIKNAAERSGIKFDIPGF